MDADDDGVWSVRGAQWSCEEGEGDEGEKEDD